ncbi:DUF6479 family protein [Streptomyces sp. NPDC018610]|uniref:DUF6479 family protein n=1 Tax=Streptomyces sp. NPDC018610 TaxID=3365049 RepID=UPI0037ABC070
MDTTGYTAAAGAPSVVGIILVVVGGLIVVGLLVWAVRLGIKVMHRESRTPRGGEHPTLPESGPVHETQQRREPDEVPRAEDTGRRLSPHELGSPGSRRSEDQDRPRWDEGSSGSFGSGGPGGR